MKITRYDEKRLPGTICLRRETTRMEFPSGRWAEVTRYTYADRIEISAIGSTPGDYAPYRWGQLHRFGAWIASDQH